jgi:hypothetical protein
MRVRLVRRGTANDDHDRLVGAPVVVAIRIVVAGAIAMAVSVTIRTIVVVTVPPIRVTCVIGVVAPGIEEWGIAGAGRTALFGRGVGVLCLADAATGSDREDGRIRDGHHHVDDGRIDAGIREVN